MVSLSDQNMISEQKTSERINELLARTQFNKENLYCLYESANRIAKVLRTLILTHK